MTYLVECERLDHFGRGIAYIDGKITFISNFLPEEKANIKIIENKKNYNIGQIISLKKESKDRIKPTCEILNCGCALKHLNYQKQLEFKENKVKDIINRYTKLNPKINKIIKSENQNGYRNKITLKVNNHLGYHENKTNNFIPIKKCELAKEKINELIKILNKQDLTNTKEIVIKSFDETMIIIKGKLDIEPLKNITDSIYLNDELVHGKPFITTKINDLNFLISSDSFFQVNDEVVEKLYNKVLEYAGDDYNSKVLDLYSGTGTISLILAKKFKQVIGIEINKDAVKCANENKKINDIKNASFICGDVSNNLDKLKADIIVVDPPRSGLSKKAVDDILKINPNRLIYISCDPMTLARDINILKDKYDIIEMTPADMFPNTYHVESITLLQKKQQ